MKNKFLSYVLAALVILSCFGALSVSAEEVVAVLPENIGTDYQAIPLSQRTDNAILDPTGWGQNYYDLTGFAETNSQNTYTIAAGAVDNYADESTNAWAAAGLIFSKSKIDTSVYEPGASLVFSASVLSHNTNNPKLTWGLYQRNYKSVLPVEYPTRTVGFTTSNTAWTTFGATIVIPEECDVLSDANFNFGFSSLPAPASSNYAVNINRSSMYLAPEAVGDIKVSADKSALMAGAESITVDADVLNQVGSTGSLSQSVTWYALDSERTTPQAGIYITAGENGTATVTTDSALASGEYWLVAVSDAYPELRKGIKITVSTLAADFVKVPLSQRTDNVISDPTGWGQNYDGLTGFAETNSQNTYTLAAVIPNQHADDDIGKWAAAGLLFSKSKLDTSIYRGGATLVFSASVLSHNTNNPKVTWGIYQANYKSILPLEYPSRVDGMETSSTEWRTFGATVHIPEVIDTLTNTQFNFGFSKMDAPASSNYAVNINRSSMYLAPEAASDIIVTADKTSCLAGENAVVTVDADILNQVGNKGYLSQNVTWYVMNAERTEILSGFDITYGEDGTATIALPTDLAKGKYSIVAMSDINSSLIKGIPFTVASLDDYVPGDPNEGNVITEDTTYSMTYNPEFKEYDDYLTLSYDKNVTVNGRPAQGYSVGNIDKTIFNPGNPHNQEN